LYELFQEIKQFLVDFPEAAVKTGPGIYQFYVTGDVPTYWNINLKTPPGKVTKRKAANPDVTFTIADKHLMRVSEGKLNIQTAFIQGRLKIDGELDKAMKVGGMLGKLMKERKKK
ncbi:MAG: SCP2 sterol-binding domain-containing protein, partial [Bacteroidota bacterium]